MRATKENILDYLKELKVEFSKEGIASFALFGSFAKDTQSVYSDIDIAISKKSDYMSDNSSYSYFETVSKIKEDVITQRLPVIKESVKKIVQNKLA